MCYTYYMKEYYIYTHTTNGEIFYVGMGIGNRLNDLRLRNTGWYEIVNQYGFESEVIENNLTQDEAYEREKFHIKRLGRKDLNLGKLVNLTDGGKGNLGYIWKPNSRLKISIAHKGKPSLSSTKFKKGLIPYNKGISKYEFFLNGRGAEYQPCKFCGNDFLKRIDKKTKFCSKQCYGQSKIKTK